MTDKTNDAKRRNSETEERRFAAFDMANPGMWELFEKFTFELIANGKTRYGVGGVIHRIRWETDMATRDGTPFKVNSNWAPYYSRKFHAKYPQYDGFFSMRQSRADEEDFGALEDVAAPPEPAKE